MKFTLSWLKEYLDTDASLDEVTERLTEVGIEVEKVVDRAAELKDYVVGYVETCEKHPDADKLNVTTVDTGREKLQVVCGAPNCRQGIKGVFAPAGTYVPGIDVTLKKAKIRGVESNGMLCSEAELCLSEESAGIIELPEDAKIGASAATVLGLDDPVIEIEVTPNRPDTCGIYGIARDLAAKGMGTLKTPDFSAVEKIFDNPVKVAIKPEATESCPMFLGRYIKGVKNTPSPKWLQDRLRAVGLRPISTLVDITNLMTLGFARPMHVYDADKLQGDIHVRLSKKGEELEALNDKSYTLDDGMCVICDDSGVLGLGGIVGGVPSGVTDETTNVFLEAAYFNPTSIALTGRSLMVDSDARYRFERGVDPEFTFDGMEYATKLVLELCGGEVSDVVQAGDVPPTRDKVVFDPAKTYSLGGIDIPLNRQAEILESLGFGVDQKSDSEWHISVPSWRPDVDADGRADMVEEILRIYGYDHIPVTSLDRPKVTSTSPLTISQQRVSKLRRLLAGRGLSETVTWSFMESEKADLFGANQNQAAAQLKITNPISSDLDQMRPSTLPNLLIAAQKNADRALFDACFFEIGHVYHTAKADGQVLVATGLRTGNSVPRHWNAEQRKADFYDVKSDVFDMTATMGLQPEKLQLTTDAPEWYHPGRSACLRMGKNVLAQFGELHPGVLSDLGIKVSAVGFEFFVDNVPVPKNKSNAFKPLDLLPLQPLARDFAFLVDETVTADELVRAAANADKNLISAVDVFDVYQGKGVEDGKKSVALSVTLQPKAETLTEQDIEAVSKKVVDLVGQKTGGILRG
jgi:phenylalanyl-tRNA synthetase beta chain